ncbi:MAG: winged helix-turn-helix transcriptional regulator [Magnetovibrio sp.]|nr:winged helix-turn-helix transcriptional regulator [Magnetovibrio sp.]
MPQDKALPSTALASSRGLVQTSACACFNVRKAARAVTQHFAGFMSETGLTETQFSILALLAQTGPQTGPLPMGKLAEMLFMDRTTLTRNVRPLQTKALVDIVPGQDSRTREVMITDPGLEALNDALPAWSRAQESLLASFGHEDWRDLKGRLEHLTAATRSPRSP